MPTELLIFGMICLGLVEKQIVFPLGMWLKVFIGKFYVIINNFTKKNNKQIVSFEHYQFLHHFLGLKVYIFQEGYHIQEMLLHQEKATGILIFGIIYSG